jgi:serine/threonine-protein kinase BUR1
LVALKKIIMHNEKDGVGSAILAVLEHFSLTRTQFPITALREIKLLKLLSHKNVLKLEDMAVEHPPKSSKIHFPQSRDLTNKRPNR